MPPSGPADNAYRFDGLRALYVNCTLKRSPEVSNTDGLIDRSRAVLIRRYMSWPRGHAGDWADDFVSIAVAFGHSVPRAERMDGIFGRPSPEPYRHRQAGVFRRPTRPLVRRGTHP